MTQPRILWDSLRETWLYARAHLDHFAARRQSEETEVEWLAAIRDAFDDRPCEALSSRDPGHVAPTPHRSPPDVGDDPAAWTYPLHNP